MAILFMFFGFLASKYFKKSFKLFMAFLSFWLLSYLMKVIPELRRVQ